MASFTFSPDVRFQAGATLHAYPCIGMIPTGGAVDSTTVASDGTATFTNLTAGTRYLAGLTRTGPFSQFKTASVDSTETLVGRVLWNGTAWEFAGTVTTVRPAFAGMLFWIGGGPGADPTPDGFAIAAEGDVWLPSEPVD